jgi:hypothetical protein
MEAARTEVARTTLNSEDPSMGDALLTGVVSRVFGIDGGVTVSGRGVLMA